MTVLGEFMNDDTASLVARHTVKVGDVYLMEMDFRNGITPKAGDLYRNKFFVVLGFDDAGNVYGGVVINSRVNSKVDQNIQDWHYPIKKSRYSFLKHDSFVDCSQLKKAFIEKFSFWEYKGRIFKDDLDLIIGAVQSSPKETKANLSRYGL
ncbi:MAG: hypothetical protein IAC08_05610 [Bacteroidetes bacterium]|uniref:Uncharacterized protein n=1 Tax=Candidatus Cryptobacteroides intestinigallinarum TaxID=2840767 RepID=A0A9D9HL61_9BACT|nr:hypothetical protein [Candidatus Cryptobacteroides intestinigallinarum]